MKTIRILPLLLAASSLAACSWWSRDVAVPGNPNQTAYAGEPGSVYDAAANPPRDIGQVAYFPAPPTAPSAPMPPAMGPAVTTLPLSPLPGARPPVR